MPFTVSRRLVFTSLLAVLALVGLAVLIRQPWQHRTKVLSADIPGSYYAVELWEKPYWCFGFGYEYETWFVVRSPVERERWYLIGAEYITLRDVVLLLSSDHSRIRIETDGESERSHMIAEYDFRQGEFRAESEPTVRNTEGWAVLSVEKRGK